MKKMNKILPLIFAGIFCSLISSYAQLDLPLSFTPYYLKDSTIVEFDKTAAAMEAKSIGMGHGGVNTYYKASNEKSIVRFSASSVPDIVIKVDSGTELLELVVLGKAETFKKTKNYRLFVKGGTHLGGSKKDFEGKVLIPRLIPYYDNVYKIVFDSPLGSGEYAFMPIFKGEQSSGIMTSSGKHRLYCFGLDA